MVNPAPSASSSASSQTDAGKQKRKRTSAPIPAPVPARASSSKPIAQQNVRVNKRFTVPRLQTGVSAAKVLQSTKTTTTYSIAKPPPPQTTLNTTAGSTADATTDIAPEPSTSQIRVFPLSSDPSWSDPASHVFIGEDTNPSDGLTDKRGGKRQKGRSGKPRKRKRRVSVQVSMSQ